MTMPLHMKITSKSASPSVVSSLSGIAILLLYTYLTNISSYTLTVGGVFAIIIILITGSRLKVLFWPLALGLFFILWPLLVMAGSVFVGAGLTPEPLEFATSYALWLVSVTLLTLAFITTKDVQLRGILMVQIVLTGLMAAQFIGARFTGNMIGYEVVAPLLSEDIFGSYLGLEFRDGARAIGTYYEPSMCARVMGTICFIDLMRGGRVARNICFLIATLLFTQSLGLIVMICTIGVIIYGRSIKRIGIYLILLIILSIIAVPLFSSRSFSDRGSTYVRIMAPIEAITFSMTNYPAGIPIGSMENLAKDSGFFRNTMESKITNGVYEFTIYFGLIGLVLLTTIVIYAMFMFYVGETEISSALMYLLISTALSGSFLSIESSLLTYFYIVSARSMRSLKQLKARSRATSRSVRLAGHTLRRVDI